MSRDEEALLERARETPPTRAGVRALSQELAPGMLAPALRLAVRLMDEQAVTALGMAAWMARERLDRDLLADVLALVETMEQAIGMASACSDDPLAALLAVLDRGRASNPRMAALILAAALMSEGEAPPALVTHLRLVSHRTVDPVEGITLAVAALELGDPDAIEVTRPWSKLAGELRSVMVENALGRIGAGPDDVLPETEEPAVVSGFTVRRAVAKVGRNDPCPCGSGKKYKKCCAGKDAERQKDPSPVAGLTMKEYRSRAHEFMSLDELGDLRPAELARLPPAELTPLQLVMAIQRLSIFAAWEPAERLMAELAGRSDAPGPADGYREDLIAEAFRMGAVDVARRQIGLMQSPENLEPGLRLRLDLTDADHPVLGQLEQAARRGLGEGYIGDRWAVGFALLETHPALGILVSRGLLSPDSPIDGETLLECIEEARDRLGLPPNDPAWETYERMDQERYAEGLKEMLGHASQKLVDEIETLRGEAAARSEEVRELDRQLRARSAEIRTMSQAAPRPSPASQRADREPSPKPDERERLARLQQKVDDLEERIRAGNKARAEMRRRLACLEEEARSEVAGGAQVAARDEAAEGDTLEEAPGRDILLPEHCAPFRAALETLPRRVAADAVHLLAGLATGEGKAWRQVKKLKGVDSLYSARVGIHHRLLFRIDTGRHALEALELVTREDLDTAVRRLRR